MPKGYARLTGTEGSEEGATQQPPAYVDDDAAIRDDEEDEDIVEVALDVARETDQETDQAGKTGGPVVNITGDDPHKRKNVRPILHSVSFFFLLVGGGFFAS